jgi:hypothetical protein
MAFCSATARLPLLYRSAVSEQTAAVFTIRRHLYVALSRHRFTCKTPATYSSFRSTSALLGRAPEWSRSTQPIKALRIPSVDRNRSIVTTAEGGRTATRVATLPCLRVLQKIENLMLSNSALRLAISGLLPKRLLPYLLIFVSSDVKSMLMRG